MGTNMNSYTHIPSDLSRALTATSPARQTACPNIYKWYLRCSASRWALVVSDRADQFARLGGQVRAGGETPLRNLGVWASMLWVMQWVLRFAMGGHAREGRNEPYFTQEAGNESRAYRRFIARISKRAGRPMVIRAPEPFRILCKGLSYAKRNELLARLSNSGRVRIYGIRFIGPVLQRLAVVTPFDQQEWCAPTTSAVADGLWYVQLPPN